MAALQDAGTYWTVSLILETSFGNGVGRVTEEVIKHSFWGNNWILTRRRYCWWAVNLFWVRVLFLPVLNGVTFQLKITSIQFVCPPRSGANSGIPVCSCWHQECVFPITAGLPVVFASYLVKELTVRSVTLMHCGMTTWERQLQKEQGKEVLHRSSWISGFSHG